MTTSILFSVLVLCLIARVPIGISLGIAALSTISYSGIVTTRYLAQTLTTSLDSFPLMAVPFFILAGDLMGTGGISRRLILVANTFLGGVTGGMAIVTVTACMAFAAISGSGPATVAAIGGLVIPEMLRQGYDKRFVCGLIAAAGTIGVIIPPSIPMVIYSVVVSSSISRMFMAGIIPGLLVGAGLVGYAYWYSRRMGYRFPAPATTFAQKFAVVREAKWALAVPVIILGGIYGGVFTPTEAAAIAVIYGFVMGKFVYRELSWSDVPRTIANSALTTATILIIIGTATSFGRILTLEHIPDTIASAIAQLSSPVLIMLLIVTLLLFVGCFMETLASIIILAPILLPIALNLGLDPTYFGIVMVVGLAIGFVTPPLGVNLFVTCGIADIPLDTLSRAILPWIGVLVTCLLLITLFPGLSLFLPRLLM
ncbi:C4-dicarboxylate transport system (Permease large protein) [uncultured Alphaproteobacteria bacterium]|uniref:TRAP transporter large permease protein n=1 Tax=uncultured Alphaproteobacteria bacterium TaxID=91750 RepID=A0A212JTX0_9PROT|nr:C4-dicarboxylate transport system (Permease large protein) [uncultured Alphaproteobacteria bacterium]